MWIIHHNKDLGFARFLLSYYWLLLLIKIWKPNVWFIFSHCVCRAQLISITNGSIMIYTGHCLIELAMVKFKVARLIKWTFNILHSAGEQKAHTASQYEFSGRFLYWSTDRWFVRYIVWRSIGGQSIAHRKKLTVVTWRPESQVCM